MEGPRKQLAVEGLRGEAVSPVTMKLVVSSKRLDRFA